MHFPSFSGQGNMFGDPFKGTTGWHGLGNSLLNPLESVEVGFRNPGDNFKRGGGNETVQRTANAVGTAAALYYGGGLFGDFLGGSGAGAGAGAGADVGAGVGDTLDLSSASSGLADVGTGLADAGTGLDAASSLGAFGSSFGGADASTLFGGASDSFSGAADFSGTSAIDSAFSGFGDAASSTGSAASAGTNWWQLGSKILGGAGSLYGIYNGMQQQKAAKQQQQRESAYQDQMQSLMANPNSITNDPGYQFGIKQGEEGLLRTSASRGMTGSGGEAAALKNLDQQYAGQYLGQKENALAAASGHGLPYNAGQDLMGGGINSLILMSLLQGNR